MLITISALMGKAFSANVEGSLKSLTAIKLYLDHPGNVFDFFTVRGKRATKFCASIGGKFATNGFEFINHREFHLIYLQ